MSPSYKATPPNPLLLGERNAKLMRIFKWTNRNWLHVWVVCTQSLGNGRSLLCHRRHRRRQRHTSGISPEKAEEEEEPGTTTKRFSWRKKNIKIKKKNIWKSVGWSGEMKDVWKISSRKNTTSQQVKRTERNNKEMGNKKKRNWLEPSKMVGKMVVFSVVADNLIVLNFE